MEQPSMLKYIKDQPRALRETFNKRSIFTEPFNELFSKNNIRKIYLLGSGTSYNASLAGAEWFKKYLHVEAVAMIPTHFTNYESEYLKYDSKLSEIAVIGISQSGTSVSTIDAIKKSEKLGLTTVAITENLESLITNETKNVIKLTCGKEEIPVETRGYSVTLFELFLLVIECAKNCQKITNDEYEKIINQCVTFLDYYSTALNETEKWYEEHRDEFLGMNNTVISSYGINECTGIEGVLKLGETWKKPIISYNMEEMIHGPQNAFDENTYVFIIASKEVEFSRVPLFVKWFHENHVTEHLFVITNGDLDIDSRGLKFNEQFCDDLSPLLFTLPFQIIAAVNCINVGIDTAKRVPNRKAFAHYYPKEN